LHHLNWVKKEFLFSPIKFFTIYRNKGALDSISFALDIQKVEGGSINKIRYINHKLSYYYGEKKQRYDIANSFIIKIRNGILLWQYELIKDKQHFNPSKRTYRLI
jgi:hypothetical protein